MKIGKPEKIARNGKICISGCKEFSICKNKLFLAGMILILIINFVGSVFALTGSLGNARMVISKNENGNPIKAGDVIEKYVLVKNVNNVSINVGLRVSGDLAKNIVLKENEFTLEPGIDKKAYFTINVPTNGTTESRIEVTFSSDTQKNGVGLASTIIVIAGEGDGTGDGNFSIDRKTIAIVITSIVVIVLLIIVSVYLKKNKLKKSAETE